MNTQIIKIDGDTVRPEELSRGAEILKKGCLVAFPTETVYGLGADALNPQASGKIYEAKGRPSDNPLIVHIAYARDMERLAREVPESAYRLAEVFWPGPLTILLNKSEIVPDSTTGGLSTVALRLPANRIARALIEQSGVFIAAPSANISGKPSPTLAKHVIDDFNGRIDMIIDGGQAALGLESTIVDLTENIPMILRPGCITKEMLEHVLGTVEYDPAILKENSHEERKPKAPGMRYRHYAPEGNLTIYEGEPEAVVREINYKAKSLIEQGKTVGIIATGETQGDYPYGIVQTIGTRQQEESIAAGLYATLREFDRLHTEYIFSESFTENTYGQAIMDRLLKAAGYRVVKVS